MIGHPARSALRDRFYPRAIVGRLRRKRVRNRFPPGHHYSPVPDDRELGREPRRSQVWPAAAPDTPGIDWRDSAQLELLAELGEQPRLTWPNAAPGDGAAVTYVNYNPMFPPLDAWLLEAMLRKLQPRRLIEVGSGYSSLVSARVNAEALAGRIELTCIDPFPPTFLDEGIAGIASIVRCPIQDVGLESFLALDRGDVLFIDTSHTVKTGGDVPWIYNHILPRLAPGVVVHLHDIFLPRDYPREWVLEGWGWNEQYLVQSFLAFNRAYEILAGVGYLREHHRDALARAFPDLPRYLDRGGSSLWIRRTEHPV